MYLELCLGVKRLKKIKNQIAAETESAQIDRVQHASSTTTTLENIEEVPSWLTNDESAQNIAQNKAHFYISHYIKL